MTKPNRIVIWGLKYRYHTHRHIHKAFYLNAKKLGYRAIWLEDIMSNQKHILPGDLIIASEVTGRMIKEKNSLADYSLPIRSDVFYCLHNYKDVFKSQLDQSTYINLQVYNSNHVNDKMTRIDAARYWDTKTRTLFQPWGTDLLPEEFKRPVYNNSKISFWIGSIWNNKLNQGNINEINELTAALKRHDIKFINLQFIPDWLNILLIRFSRIAPAIAGKFQVDVNYLPCRVFKNISYGQLGITNVKKFKELLGESYVCGDTITELIKTSMGFSEYTYKKLVSLQQEKIVKYTYKESLGVIINKLIVKYD